MNRSRIITNFTAAPTIEDLEAIADDVLETLPVELARHCENLAIQVEDFPDVTVENEYELETPYDIVALFRSGSQIAPGVKSKVANDEDVLILYRRVLLDMWSDTGDDLNILVRQIMIEELAQNFEFSEDDIEALSSQPHR